MKKTIAKIFALSLVAVMMCAALTACSLFGPSSDPDKALEALKDSDYAAEKIDSTLGLAGYALIGIDIEELECVVAGSSKDGDEGINIFYFEDKDAANDAFEKIEKFVEELTEDRDEDDPEIVVKKSGKMVYYGTKEAVKAAK